MRPQRSRLISKLDKEWAKQIRSVGHCEYEGCNKITNLNAHHIYGRGARSTRWELDNGICLCVNHHIFSNEFSAHQTPLDFANWLIKSRGDKWYENLESKHKEIVKFTIQDLKDKLKELILHED